MEDLGRKAIRGTIESILERAEAMSDTKTSEEIESFLKGVNDICTRNNIPITEYQARIDTILGTTYARVAEDLTKEAFVNFGVIPADKQKLRIVGMGDGASIDGEGVVYIRLENSLFPRHLTLAAYEKLKEPDFNCEIKVPIKYEVIDISSGLKSVVVRKNKEAVSIATIAGANSSGPYTIESDKKEHDISFKNGELEVLLKVPSAQFGKRDDLRIGKDRTLFILNEEKGSSNWLPLYPSVTDDKIESIERSFYEVARRGYNQDVLRKAIQYAMKSKTMSKEYFKSTFIPDIRNLIRKSNALLHGDNLENKTYSLGAVDIPVFNQFSN